MLITLYRHNLLGKGCKRMVNASNSGLNYLQRYDAMPVFHNDWVKKGMNGEKKTGKELVIGNWVIADKIKALLSQFLITNYLTGLLIFEP